MIASMTAFARARRESAGYAVSVEVRTLNSKGLDVILRFPRAALELEEAARKIVAEHLSRGRVEVSAQVEQQGGDRVTTTLNAAAATAAWNDLLALASGLPGCPPPGLADLLKYPGLFEQRETPPDLETLSALLRETLAEALAEVKRMRATEGETLMADLLSRAALLRAALDRVEARRGPVVIEYQRKLADRIRELTGEAGLDEARLLQEVAIYADRSDITEEIVRARSHLDQIEAMCAATDAASGRTLDFLAQELHREANTIGSKTNDLDIGRVVLHMKTEINKMKEQVQNIE